MNHKIKASLAATLGLLFVGSASALTITDAGTVNFTGQVVDSPCVVAQSSANQNVILDDIPLTEFIPAGSTNSTAGDTGGVKKSFDIVMEECTSGAVQNMTFTFKGESPTSNPDVLANNGDAVDVGIALYEENGSTALKLNEASSPLTIPEAATTGTKTFKAGYIVTGDAASTGSVEAVATFDVTFS